MITSDTSSIFRLVLLATIAAALMVFSAQSSTGSSQTFKREDPDCDIDGSLRALDDCPSETIIRQYKERYDLTVALRGGTYWIVISGQYANEIYGYTVSLPDGVEALCTLPPAPWHGFFVDVANELEPATDASAHQRGLSWDNRTVSIDVDGSYNALDYSSADEAADATLGYYKKDHPDLVILCRTRTKLRGLPASRDVIQFVDSKSGDATIAEEEVAISEDRDIIYTFSLMTTPARYAQDQIVLNQIVKGFRLIR